MEFYSTEHRRLDTFIKNNLEPNEFNTKMKDAVHRICSFLRNRCFINQSDIKVIRAVKGGSSGKGTALRIGSDADLVVFLSCFNSFQDQRNTRQEILEGIQQTLKVCAQSIAHDISDITITFPPNRDIPPKSMSFTLKSRKSSDSVDFDILPTFDALKGTENTTEAHLKLIDLVRKTGDLNGEFSACFTELQRNFVKQYEPKLKDLIRLLKYWYKQYVRKSELRPGERLPAKYAVELLTIYAWEQGNGKERFSTAEGLRTVLELICKYQHLCIYWTKYYNVNDRVIADFLMKKLRDNRPIILDPADPTGNVATSQGWHVMAKEAKKCLESQCVSGVQAWDVQPMKEFEITVFRLDGTSLNLNVNITSKISMIKDVIQRQWNVPASQQRLTFNETILADNTSLLDSGIFFDANLQLLMIKPMEIFARDTDGRTMKIDVLPTDTVSSLKTKIESLKRISSSQYYLTFESKPIEDGHTLEYYGIKQHSEITIHLRLRGGKKICQHTRSCPPAQVYLDLINANGDGGEFSTCFTELQRNFVKRRPAKLKGLIRLVKHWYKEYVRPYKNKLRHGEFLPPKYALELLIIYAWQSVGEVENFNTAAGFCTIMELIIRYRELWLFWTDNYNFDSLDSFLTKKLAEPRPMILDPADPTGNVAGNARWDFLAEEAERCLQQGCLLDVIPWDVEPVKSVRVTVIPMDISCSRQPFSMSPFLPIRHIKQHFGNLPGIPMSSCYLEWNNQTLNENLTLSDYKIFYDVTICLKEQAGWCILI
ncbi:2'-5'-oligoadenylate synthase-like protein 2 [Scyliorhinus torazame]|uniref:2'-5'-oligoadenylate synthase-like protein 2 n=1 Tax=Scyliorhinus torazame TaxID=75743 RepID=UPI003B58B4C7